MKTGQKVAAFVVALAVVFALAVWVGTKVGPHDAPVERTAAVLPGGLQSTQDGYALELADTIAVANPEVPLQFRIVSASGEPVMRFATVHEKVLHLIVAEPFAPATNGSDLWNRARSIWRSDMLGNEPGWQHKETHAGFVSVLSRLPP